MIKFLLAALLISVGVRWVLGKWPWEYLKAKPTRSQAVHHARKLLAVREEASRSDIVEAHKRLIAIIHPDRGGTSAQVHEANAARDLLLDHLPDET